MELKDKHPKPPPLEREAYAAARILVKIAAEKSHGIYIKRGAFENSGTAILVCAGDPADVDAVISFGERLKGKYVKTSQITGKEYVIHQPKEQKTKMKITKIGYGLRITERYSGTAEEVYMEAEVEESEREFLGAAVENLKRNVRVYLSGDNTPKILAANLIALEQRVSFHQEQLKTLRSQLDKLQGVWSAIESLFGKFVGGDRPTGEPELYKAEPTEQQQH